MAKPGRPREDRKFNRRLRTLREQRKLSLREAAPFLGITYAHLSRLETGGKHDALLSFLQRTALFYCTTVSYLIGEIDVQRRNRHLPEGPLYCSFCGKREALKTFRLVGKR